MANAVDAALNGVILYLEAMLLLVIISTYGIDTVLLDIRFMCKEHPRGILVYMKYSWIISFILIALAIILKWVFLFRGYIAEILIIVFIFLPLFLYAIYNTFKYLLRGVKATLLIYATFYFKQRIAEGQCFVQTNTCKGAGERSISSDERKLYHYRFHLILLTVIKCCVPTISYLLFCLLTTS